MQAIQGIENAAMEVPHRSSPFRALLWKEWRQQRWIFLSLAGLAYALLVSALIVDRYGSFFHDLRNEAASVLGGCAMLLGIAGVVVLSANAFAGERDDNTDLFLANIPCSRSRLFQVKLGFVLFLVLLGVCPLGATALVQQPHNFVQDFKELALVLAADGFVLALVPALVASFGGSVIATILASIPVTAACVACTSLSRIELPRFLPVASRMGMDLIALFTIILINATIFVAARRMWIRVERSRWSSLSTAAAVVVLFNAYVALPCAAAYFYVTCVAPLGYFLKANSPFIRAWPAVLSPNGKYIICLAGYEGWGSEGSRAAVVDVDSRRSQWMTRFYYSDVFPTQRIWSPSGNQFVLAETDLGLWPFARGEGHVACFVVDAHTGEKHKFEELCPVLKTLPSPQAQMDIIGWYSERIFAFGDDREILFADVKNHKVQRCAVPRFLPRAKINPWRSYITDRGIFPMGVEEGQVGGMRVLCFAPELSEADILDMPGIPNSAWLDGVSRDGRRLIINTQVIDPNQAHGMYYTQVERYIARLQDGVELTLLTSPKPGVEGLISPSWEVHGFLRDGHQVLLQNDKEIALFDTDSHTLRQIPLQQEKEGTISRVVLSPQGGFAIVELTKGTGETRSLVVDLRLGTFRESKVPVRWLGEDRLLLQEGKMPLVMNRDGTGARPLLAE